MMVEYGVNVTNKFGFLSDDEEEDPGVILRRAEAANRKEEKTASQKKADKNAAAKKKKDAAAAAAAASAAAAAALNAAADAKRTANVNAIATRRSMEANKENRPEGERGRGRGRGRGIGRGARGVFFQNDMPRTDTEQVNDTLGDRFGESRGRGRGRGFMRGARPPFRGGRGGGFGGVQHFDGAVPGEQEPYGEERRFPNTEVTEQGEYVRSFGRGGGRGAPRGRGGRGRGMDRMTRNDEESVPAPDAEHVEGADQQRTEVNNDGGDEVNARDAEQETDPAAVDPEAEMLAKQLTLDEFKAQMAAKHAEPQFNIRKAGEGISDKEFGKLVPLTKQPKEAAADEEIVVVRREPRIKKLDIEINFTDDQRGGRGGGRGRGSDGFRRGMGRGMRGEGRAVGRQQQNFEVSADAFPALGAA